MAYKFRISLHGSKPAVSRTVVLEQDTGIRDAALVFITAMGWRGGRTYCFVADIGADDPKAISHEMEPLFTAEDLCEMDAALFYDVDTGWRVDIGPGEETEETGPKVLAWKGECPNQLLLGISDFNRIRKAAKDPSDPYHDQAEAWLGTVPTYDMEEVNRRLEDGDLAMPPVDHATPDASWMPVRAMLHYAREQIKARAARTEGFRCPQCGSVCEGRENLELSPTMVNSVAEYTVSIVCPKCRFETVLTAMNDGFSIGYHEEGSCRPQGQQQAIYDALLRKDDPRDPFEEAMYQAELACLYDKYRYRRDNSGTVAKCLAGLDKKDPRFAETDIICREAILLHAINGRKDVLGSTKGFTGALGAMAMVRKDYSFGTLETSTVKKAMKMLESDPGAGFIEKCAVAYIIACNASDSGDCEALSWTASVLEDVAAEADERTEALESAEWWALCTLMEAVVCGLHEVRKVEDAGRALGCMAGPFADRPDHGAPPAVRNLVLFRRALLLLSSGGNREQALRDLDRFMESVRGHEDNGIYTMRRMPYAAMLRADSGRMRKGEMTWEMALAANILVQLFSAGLIASRELEHALADFVSLYTEKGYSYSRICDIFKTNGLILTDKRSEPCRFNPGLIWHNDMTVRL